MPDSLSDLLHRGERIAERAPVYEGKVAQGASGLGDAVTVTIRGFDEGRLRWPVDGWMPRGDTFPKRGDKALVTLSDRGRLWLLVWMPTSAGHAGEKETPIRRLTQAEYNALTPPDPDTLYVIVG